MKSTPLIFIAIALVGVIMFFLQKTIPIISQTAIVSSGTSSSQQLKPEYSDSYNKLILADHPVAFWNVDPVTAIEPDLSGYGNNGTYKGGLPTIATLPNGDKVADFNGSSQYLTIPSRPSFSISDTGSLTWEAWIRPDTLQFPYSSKSNYVDFMGKCQSYNPTCEWEARMYDSTTEQVGRSSRISAYVFNSSAGLGSAADWQPSNTLIKAGQWIYVVGEYTTHSQPAKCQSTSTYPGSINIWVDGIEWNQAEHNPTGCMSQYKVIPRAKNSPLNIGTMAFDTWFKGAVGKVAIYNYLLTPSMIATHYQVMTGTKPTGSCQYQCTL